MIELNGYKGFGERLKNLRVGNMMIFGSYYLPTGSKPNESVARMPIT